MNIWGDAFTGNKKFFSSTTVREPRPHRRSTGSVSRGMKWQLLLPPLLLLSLFPPSPIGASLRLFVCASMCGRTTNSPPACPLCRQRTRHGWKKKHTPRSTAVAEFTHFVARYADESSALTRGNFRLLIKLVRTPTGNSQAHFPPIYTCRRRRFKPPQRKV